MKKISFVVYGNPVPKQSFIYGKGRGRSNPRAQQWQWLVSTDALLSMNANKLDVFEEKLIVTLDFILPDNKRKDLDNLGKAVLDACNRTIWKDDSQIVDLRITKKISKENIGVTVTIMETLA